ncbi:MAG: GspE/PulE family protein, partial [Candidatus Babeliales bacterium]
ATMFEALQNLLHKPYGLFLVTGPTGAGKTTTLYAMLNKLNSPKDNIITMEDPVEYDLDGVTQSQINLKAGFSFETGLRALLRQDPDIIMLGEIRDKITARIAIESALTGHLVLSTLHTNDAPGAITRLIEMGVEPYLINASLSGVLAQRLLRRLCQECKKETVLTSLQKNMLEKKGLKLEKIYEAQGCGRCFNIGYSGRVGIFEFLTVNDLFRENISEAQTTEKLRELAVEQGMTTLMDDGIKKVEQGLISLDELFAVVL